MTPRSTTHATFEIDRQLAAAPSRVYGAWADAELKRSWFACHDDWPNLGYELDFRVGGRERNVVSAAGTEHVFEGVYLDIVPDYRIIYAYEMRVGDRRVSASLATVVFERCGRGTRMKFTEQVVFLDGYPDDGERRRGTEEGFERFEKLLAGQDGL